MTKKVFILFLSVFLLGFVLNASAGTLGEGSAITGGDAVSMAVANVLLDIAFVVDTSGSMDDDANAISTEMPNVIANLECPDCDVWIRASFFGINNDPNWGVFTTALTGSPINNLEDNAPAVNALINQPSLWSNSLDALTGQDYYRAIVTIGDEGTEDGYEPSGINEADWLAASIANQAAINNDVFIFSVVGTPWSSYALDKDNRDAVFSAMAIGGSGYGLTLNNTGGSFLTFDSSASAAQIQTDLEEIICIAAQGGQSVPEPATMFLLGSSLIGLLGLRRKK